ncbi:L-arabinose ABC transporter substrate-binding protein [Citrobacter koseri]|nr:L-arabinose ABC transporter substrate-binding protein [Citrobacter koseri]
MHKFTKALAAIGLAAVMSQSAIAETMKLGFLGETTGGTLVPDRMEICR